MYKNIFDCVLDGKERRDLRPLAVAAVCQHVTTTLVTFTPLMLQKISATKW